MLTASAHGAKIQAVEGCRLTPAANDSSPAACRVSCYKSTMDTDPCAEPVKWSVLSSAVPDLTLAGVLAGFLIAVVAALLVQWYDRASPRMIALFASGVPALTLSSYLFTISSGTIPTKEYCNQMWSQWLAAFAMLLIGGSVLLCGLGWALVIYSDHLAEKLTEQNFPPKRVEDSHRFFISLVAWLSLGATTGVTGLLIVANVLYLNATTGPNAAYRNATLTCFEFPPGVKWYAMFFVFLFGVYFMVRSAYLVVWRSTSLVRRDHAPVHTKSSALRGAWDNKRVRCVSKEIGIAAAIALGAQVASYLTKGVLGEQFSGHAIYVGVVVAAYIVSRLAYSGIVHVVPQDSRFLRFLRGVQATAEGYAEPDAEVSVAPSTERPDDAIQLKYSSGKLKTSSYHVVCFAILATGFSEVLTQGFLWNSLGSLQGGVALLIGGLYPAGVLLGLSYSVPAAEGVRLPEWKMWPGLRLLP
jgi:hypothetical protein